MSPLRCRSCTTPLPWEQALCGACRQRLRARQQTLVTTYAGPLIGHCQEWHPIVTVPMRLPCCGWMLEEKA